MIGRSVLKTQNLVLLSFIVRFVVLLYSCYQDLYFEVKFTDIDYTVINEAAECVLHETKCNRRGDYKDNRYYLGMEGMADPHYVERSPYSYDTYRYTPLLSYLMIPGKIMHNNLFGKFVFIMFDFLVGYVLFQMSYNKKGESHEIRNIATDRTAIMILWLFNPFVFVISVRGNSESIVCLLLVLSLYFMSKREYIRSAIFYGFSIHFKIFPILYCWAIWNWFDNKKDERRLKCGSFTFPMNGIIFGSVSLCCLLLLTMIFYYFYGYKFIYETYLYHIHRKDHRHNLSMYFYHFYLMYGNKEAAVNSVINILAFAPQAIFVGLIGRFYYRDLPFSCFLITFLFIAYNKVFTYQYFLWFICLMPMAFVYVKIPLVRLLRMFVVWTIPQGMWLYNSYLLEFHSENRFMYLYLSSVFLLISHLWIASEFINYYNESLVVDYKSNKICCE